MTIVVGGHVRTPRSPNESHMTQVIPETGQFEHATTPEVSAKASTQDAPPPRRTGRRRLLTLVAGGALLSVIVLIASSLGFSRSNGQTPAATPVPIENVDRPLALAPGASLDDTITSLRARVQRLPGDYVSWATLGLAYVQQAKIVADPSYYARAEAALARSVDEGGDDNFLAFAGLSALASARHDFQTALEYAEAGLSINAASSLLYGVLSDAQIQLGMYEEGFASVDTMTDLRPDASSLSRASYVAELRGDLDLAVGLMTRARDDAANGSNRAFALFYLGELAFKAGDPNTALGLYNQAVQAAPSEVALLAGKAKAEAAAGQIETAIGHYEQVVTNVPDPTYLIQYGELLESVGRFDEARRQYDVVDAANALYAAAGVAPDATPILFEADHGDPEQALIDAEIGIRDRPFIVMYDAYAWALHRVGRDEEASAAIDQAMELGTPYARFHFHAGMIALALGDDDQARTELTRALAINPYFDPLDAPVARETLDGLESP